MNELETKKQIELAITRFSNGSLLENSLNLLNTLGYRSQRQFILTPNNINGLVELAPDIANINKVKALVNDWLTVDFLFQLTGDDIRNMTQGRLIFDDPGRIANQIIESYLFMAIKLKGSDYPRGKLADLTREINKCFAMPVMILFQYGQQLTLSLINRRLSKREETKDVLEKVTLIKGINFAKPLRAHTEILYDLSLDHLQKDAHFQNFIELHRAWQKVLDTSELNKRFYREVADWYFWAITKVEFPAGAITDPAAPFAASVIRLITRLIFVWFIKEKGLVPHDLFNEQSLKTILNYNDPKGSTYYKAILQNLFFATLNTEMGPARQFRGKNSNPHGRDGNYGVTSLYRYQEYFKNPTEALQLFAGVPFLNGGLFECLDKREEDKIIDGFSDNPKNQPLVPDELFFGKEQSVDLSDVYGDTKHANEKVRGIIHIFNNYKFTIEENTPLEEEIALDPELLGKVFENLLAAYNPETGTTARKQTGSFYTPREIVNYMVDESVIAYLETKLEGAPDLQNRLRNLMAYNQEADLFTPEEDQRLIAAIDEIKVLDPACGSGAFPMGILHKLVYILSKLDPDNVGWREIQKRKAIDDTEEAYQIGDPEIRRHRLLDIDEAFENNASDYGRKLFLIENSIYGVDIQPIAVQIAKLRFFISLVVEQRTNPQKPNLGIRPLPNLETKFVAANTLIGIEQPEKKKPEESITDIAPDLEKACLDLVRQLELYQKSHNPDVRTKYLAEGLKLAAEINELLKNDPGFQPLNAAWEFATAKNTSALKEKLPLKQETKPTLLLLRSGKIITKERELEEVRKEYFTARTLDTKRNCRERDKQLRSEIAELLKTDGWDHIVAGLLAKWDPFDQNASATFFDPEWMFGVLHGFDVVIGNPPYITVRAQDVFIRRFIKEHYKFSGGADIYVAFIEKSLSLLISRGTLSFIVPNKFFGADYGLLLRKHLQFGGSEISSIWDLKDEKVFENALISTVVIILRKQRTGNNPILIQGDNTAEFPNLFDDDGKIQIESDENSKPIIEKMNKLPRLSSISDVRTGIMGFEYWKMEPIVYDNVPNPGYVKLYTNGNFSRYTSSWGLEPVDLYKKKYLQPIIKLDQKLINHNTRELFITKPKIIVRGVSRRLAAVIDQEGAGLLVAVHSIIPHKVNWQYLLGLLNSKLLNWYHLNTQYSIRIPQGSLKYPISFYKQLPIPLPNSNNLALTNKLENLVDQIINIRQADFTADTSNIESKLDCIIYELYGLNEVEISIVEGKG